MGNVYMEAEQVRFKDSTYHNLQTAVKAALDGGGGGGTTVIANPEGSATDDLSKLQVGTTIYDIPAEAGDISYDNASSGMTADDVQKAIDELNTGIGGISELIPSDATSSNKLATADDIPGAATTSAPGIVQPDGTSITIEDGVISAVGGSGSGETYSTSETVIGTWFGETLYRKCIIVNALPNASSIDILHGITNAKIVKCYGMARTKNAVLPNGTYFTFPYTSGTSSTVCIVLGQNLQIATTVDRSGYEGVVILEYTKVS